MKRSGFTMIELVFVIVILGILASVAIPKLAATRDDANIAKASTEISSLVSDIGSYYTAHGTFGKVSEMTNVALVDSSNADASNIDLNNSSTVYYWDKTRGQRCTAIASNETNGTLTLSEVSDANNSLFCKGLNKAINKLLAVHKFGGSSIYN